MAARAAPLREWQVADAALLQEWEAAAAAKQKEKEAMAPVAAAKREMQAAPLEERPARRDVSYEVSSPGAERLVWVPDELRRLKTLPLVGECWRAGQCGRGRTVVR